MERTTRPLQTPGILLGIGLGGFVDGIVFHQLLQLHSMLSNRLDPNLSVANLKVNMFWDGVFHAGVWLFTVIGLALLWQAVQRPQTRLVGRTLLGAMLLGWGLFNLVEGIIDHHLLQLHHVFQYGDHLTWDLAFLASGAVLIALGSLLLRGAGNETAPLLGTQTGPA
jgi:uncharacterized membrane protein